MDAKSKLIRKILNKYIPNPEIPLVHSNHFTLLIAVLLSARATDASVNKASPALFAKASTPEKMAELSVDEILEYIRPIGLAPQKAKAIKKLSEILIQDFYGKVPSTFEALESLPGVGHKTASVVMAHAFNVPAFPVDTHIYRCAHRWGLSKGKNVVKVENDLKKIFPENEWNRIHLQIILFARTYCRAIGHKKELCPMCSQI